MAEKALAKVLLAGRRTELDDSRVSLACFKLVVATLLVVPVTLACFIVFWPVVAIARCVEEILRVAWKLARLCFALAFWMGGVSRTAMRARIGDA